MKTLRNVVIYIAGPYRADTIYKLKKNIERAEEIAMKLWKAGFSVICPHKNTAFFDGELSDDNWMIGGLEILQRCDAMFLTKGWEGSKGSVKEHEYCVDVFNILCFEDMMDMIDYFEREINGK